jgi:hypothetical protein
MWDLWWTEWHWNGFFSNTAVSPANSHSTNCSTLVNYPDTGRVIKRKSIAKNIDIEISTDLDIFIPSPEYETRSSGKN